MATTTFPNALLDSACIPDLECGRRATPAKHSAADILTRAQAGDPDAFSELYLRHKKRVFSICMRMVHDSSLAEDLTQETFIQLHRKLATFRGDSAFTTWLHRMTVNIALMHLRKPVLPVVSLDHLMTAIPEEHVGRNFGTCDGGKQGLSTALPSIAPLLLWRPVIEMFSSFTMSMVLNIAKLLPCKTAPWAPRNPSCTRRGVRCGTLSLRRQFLGRRIRDKCGRSKEILQDLQMQLTTRPHLRRRSSHDGKNPPLVSRYSADGSPLCSRALNRGCCLFI